MNCELAAAGPGRWTLEFEVDDPETMLVLPEPVTPARADELWKTTCFELFLHRPGEAAYLEFNLSPSGAWAAYAFEGYRRGMADVNVAAPVIDMPPAGGTRRLRAVVTAPAPGPWIASLSAVIEEADGAKSYWALAHPSDKPDFHHPDSFVLELP